MQTPFLDLSQQGWTASLSLLRSKPSPWVSSLIEHERHLVKSIEAVVHGLHFEMLHQSISAFHESMLGVIDQAKTMLFRQILMTNTAPLVFAQVVMSDSLYQANQSIMDNLGSNPIGQALLFEQKFERSDFEFCLIDDKATLEHLSLRVGQPQLNPVWARRSRFTNQDGQCLVIELFLNHLVRNHA